MNKTKTSKKVQENLKVICYCDKCNSSIYTSPNIINTNYITGMASWHRDMPEQIKVCRNCAKELSDIIDKWFSKSKFIKGDE